MSLIIAVDGPAASGKGTIAARLARTYGLPHLDTGLLYRAVGVKLLEAGRSLDDEAAATEAARSLDVAALSDDPRLTTGEAGEAASRVAGHPGVRAALLDLQQAFAAQAGGAVLDGRDGDKMEFQVDSGENDYKLFCPEEFHKIRRLDCGGGGK